MKNRMGCLILSANLYALAVSGQAPQTSSPSPEMRRILSAQVGRWSQQEQLPDGSSGQGEVVWQAGPGNLSLVENEYLTTPKGRMTGLSVTWWDRDANGYRALWCSDSNPNGCTVMAKTAHWEGEQFVLADEFERDGKKLAYKEVESDISPSSYTLTSYIGEPGGELKPTSTIRATRLTDATAESPNAIQTQLITLTNQWTDAINAKDREKLDELMSVDYTLHAWNGRLLVSRSKWLDNLFTHITIEKNTLLDIFSRIYGDVAIVTSKGDWIGTQDGRHFNRRCTVVDTWRMLAGSWKVVDRTSDCVDQ